MMIIILIGTYNNTSLTISESVFSISKIFNEQIKIPLVGINSMSEKYFKKMI